LTGPDDHFAASDVREPTTLVHLCGRWGEETGGWGLFRVEEIERPVERGDPTPYPKRTRIDNHYHDCDECYIILAGRGTVVSEGRHYEVGPGDCVATGMGHHHDFPYAPEPVLAVYFETTLAGQRRRGHLWDHTHGKAQPQPGRM
jgi:mannose-6-phosphate isomerase-like protein (cupin superfamily)